MKTANLTLRRNYGVCESPISLVFFLGFWDYVWDWQEQPLAFYRYTTIDRKGTFQFPCGLFFSYIFNYVLYFTIEQLTE